FPEASRCLMLLGADLVILPTNWPTGAVTTVCHLVQARALENHIFFAAVNRVGEERGFRFIGQSRIIAPNADLLATGSEYGEETGMARCVNAREGTSRGGVVITSDHRLKACPTAMRACRSARVRVCPTSPGKESGARSSWRPA